MVADPDPGSRPIAMSDASSSYKDQGNACFQAGEFKDAVDFYTKALDNTSDAHSSAVLYSNRSIAHLNQLDPDKAISDADQCIALEPNWEKGYFRKGFALEHMGQLSAALEAYCKALELQPGSAQLTTKVRSLKAKVKQAKKASKQPANKAPTLPTSSSKPSAPRAGPASAPSPGGWSQGLSESQKYEWLVDCYRMRVDDDYALGGCNLHGLYNMSGRGKEDILEDFLIFCKLAVKNGVIPGPKWDWGKLLAKASELLVYAFEKSDAQEKYGSENVFDVMMGGRSLRFTAEAVYESSCTGGGYGNASKEEAALHELVDGRWRELVEGDEEGVFEEVGGAELWIDLEKQMPEPLSS